MRGESETFIRTGSSRAAAVEEQLQISARVQVHARSAHALTRTNLQSDRFLQKRVSWRQRGQKLPRGQLGRGDSCCRGAKQCESKLAENAPKIWDAGVCRKTLRLSVDRNKG